jgi:hypothetical protein
MPAQKPKTPSASSAPLRSKLKLVAPPALPEPQPTQKPQPVAAAPTAAPPPLAAADPAPPPPPRPHARFDPTTGARLEQPEAPGRMDLTKAHQTKADVPPDSKILFGRLVHYAIRNGRPMVGLEVACGCHFGMHVYPWRHDWPVSADVASLQPNWCPKRRGKPVWLLLDPSRMTKPEEVWLAAATAYETWKKEWDAHADERQAARKAKKKAEEAAKAAGAQGPPGTATTC